MTGTGVFNSSIRMYPQHQPQQTHHHSHHLFHPPQPLHQTHQKHPPMQHQQVQQQRHQQQQAQQLAQQQQQQQEALQGSSPPKAEKSKVLPPEESLPRSEVLGGYIFVCNNETMQEDLRRQLFGLPQRYRDSVRTIRPGLPLFLYNYTTHQLHGVFEATSFGGSNLDPTAWEDKKQKGESRFPAQVRIRVRRMCRALEEDEFRPFLHHYDGPKFRLELSVPETLALLDIFDKNAVQFPYPGLSACKETGTEPKVLNSRRVMAG